MTSNIAQPGKIDNTTGMVIAVQTISVWNEMLRHEELTEYRIRDIQVEML